MATPFIHTLLGPDTFEAGGDAEGMGQQTVGRTRFDFTLELAKVTSVTVVIQGAPADDDDDYTTLGTFEAGAIVSAGVYKLTSYGASADFTVEPYHEWLRAKVTAQTGDAALRVTKAGAFLDPSVAADTALVSKELREWGDGLTRTVEQAERDVRSLLLHRIHDDAGVLDINGEAAWAYDELRAMIAEQADWLMKRYTLLRSSDNTANYLGVAKYADLPDILPGIADRVRRLRPKESAYWRGR